MCFALFMVMLDNTVMNVALPSIQRTSTPRSPASSGPINAYTLSFAVLLVTGGRLGDIFGRRRVFLIGVVVFATASSALIGLSPSEALARRRPRAPGRRRRADDARARSRSSPTPSRRTSAARRSAPGPASPRSRSRSARWSAAS